MSERRLLYYEVERNEYLFRYDRYILFKNSKSSPFASIDMERKGVKKQIPLYYCEINSSEINGLKIRFYNQSCEVNFNIRCVGNTIYFFFTRKGFLGEKIVFNMFKRQGKINGLGLNSKSDLNHITASFEVDVGKKFKPLDTKLAFSVKGSYFFHNNGIEDWEVNISNGIKISTRQNSGGFIMEFGKKFEIKDIYQEIFKVCAPDEINKYLSTNKFTGIITTAECYDRMSYRVKQIRDKGYKYLVAVNPVIKKDSRDYNRMDKDGLIDIGDDNYLVSIKNEDNMRILCNNLREIFDCNVDGIFIDEINIDIKKSIVLQEALIYRNFTEMVKKISAEYPKKMNINNKMNSSEVRTSTYSLRYSKIMFKEKKYLKSLKYSNISTVYYICTPHQARRLNRRGKKQLIVLPSNKSFFKNYN